MFCGLKPEEKTNLPRQMQNNQASQFRNALSSQQDNCFTIILMEFVFVVGAHRLNEEDYSEIALDPVTTPAQYFF